MYDTVGVHRDYDEQRRRTRRKSLWHIASRYHPSKTIFVMAFHGSNPTVYFIYKNGTMTTLTHRQGLHGYPNCIHQPVEQLSQTYEQLLSGSSGYLVTFSSIDNSTVGRSIAGKHYRFRNFLYDVLQVISASKNYPEDNEKIKQYYKVASGNTPDSPLGGLAEKVDDVVHTSSRSNRFQVYKSIAPYVWEEWLGEMESFFVSTIEVLVLLKKVITSSTNGYWKKHGNGGGLVATTAYADASVYISPDSKVYGNAKILDRAQLLDNCRIYDNVIIRDDAVIADDAVVAHNALISGDALVSGNAIITGHARITDNAFVTGKSRITDNARISGNAIVDGTSVISDKCVIEGDTELLHCRIADNVILDVPVLFDTRQITGHTQVSSLEELENSFSAIKRKTNW